MSGDLTVDGTLTVNDGTTVRDTLFVSSFSRLGALAVRGDVDVSGITSAQTVLAGVCGLGSTTVAGSLTATGLCQASGLESQGFLQVGLASLLHDVQVLGHLDFAGPAATVGAGTSLVDPNGVALAGAVATLEVGSSDCAGYVSLTTPAVETLGGGSVVELTFGETFGGFATPVALVSQAGGGWNNMGLSATASSTTLTVFFAPGGFARIGPSGSDVLRFAYAVVGRQPTFA